MPTRRAKSRSSARKKSAPTKAPARALDEGEEGSDVQLALDRRLLKEGYRFDVGEADRVCQFFENYVRHSKGRWAGQLVKLERWQRRILRRLFGWRRPDGTRRYRRCYIWVPRKNGKSFLASGIALYLLIADGELGAEVFCAAANRDQAEMVYGEAKKMVNASESLLEVAEVYKSTIFVPSTLSKLEAISSKAGTKHGLNVHGIIIDEVHVFGSRELYDVLTTASGARSQPLELVISTAGTDTSSFAGELWEESRQVIDGTLAGTSAQTSSRVDTSDCDSVVFVAAFGTITTGAVTSIKVQQSSDDGSTDGYSDLEGTSVTIPDTASNKIAMIEVKRPLKRDLKLVISRGTQNAVIDGVVAIKHGLRKVPPSQHSSVADLEVHAGPAEGTA